jgi:hypothetical protein
MKKLICIAAVLTLLASSAFAQFAPEVLRVRGDAQIMKSGASEWVAVTEKMNVANGDKIKTGSDGVVAVGFVQSRKNLVRIGNNTEAVLTSGDMPVYSINLIRGDVRVLLLSLPQDSEFKIMTSAGVSTARGTGWRVVADGDTSIFEAFDNSIYVNGLYADGSVMLEAKFLNMGYKTTVNKFSAPGPVEKIPSADVDLWDEWRDEVRDIMAKANMVNN